MVRIQKLFLLLVVIGPLHMGEQLLTSIEEFYAVRGAFAHYYALFDPSAADSASVLLITIFWTIVSVMLYAVLREGLARLAVMALFGLFAAGEVHHIVQAIAHGGYDPGVITCIPYAAAGALLLEAVWREFARVRRPLTETAAVTLAQQKEMV